MDPVQRIKSTHNVIITYKDSNGWKKKYEFSYNVVDTTSPLLSISKNLYLEKGSNINNLLTNVFCGDNYDRKVDLSIDGDYDVNMIGNYDIKIKSRMKAKRKCTLFIHIL